MIQVAQAKENAVIDLRAPSEPPRYDSEPRSRVLRQYPTPTTVFILPILLPLEFCFDRATHDLTVVVPFTEVHQKKKEQQWCRTESVRVYRGVAPSVFSLLSVYLLSCVFFLHFHSLRVSRGFCLSHLVHPIFADISTTSLLARRTSADNLGNIKPLALRTSFGPSLRSAEMEGRSASLRVVPVALSCSSSRL